MEIKKFGCDRCGKEFLPNDKQKIRLLFQHDSLNPDGCIWYFESKGYEKDICPDCDKSFEKWWNNK